MAQECVDKQPIKECPMCKGYGWRWIPSANVLRGYCSPLTEKCPLCFPQSEKEDPMCKCPMCFPQVNRNV